MAKKKAKVVLKKKQTKKTRAPKPAATLPPLGAPAAGAATPAAEAQAQIKPGQRITFQREAGKSHNGSIITLRDRGCADIALDNGQELKNVPQAKDDAEVGAWTLA